MRYEINKSNYCDFETFEVNKLKPRSYFIPYPDRESADAASGKDKRYKSPKVFCLNGDWDFRFYSRPSELPDIISTDVIKWDKIDVPSCWQFRGYDKPFYVNLRYQFPYDPPKIPELDKAGKVFTLHGADYGVGPRWKDPGEEYNFVGVYRTFFDTVLPHDYNRRYTISLLGVASCADVYMNGHFIGYTEGSHNTAEFDVTPYIYDLRNELVIVVRRWCNGSYLEDQDMFRNNGIFRDVLLRVTDPVDFFDIDFHTRKAGRSYFATAKAELYADDEVTFTLKGPGISVSKTVRTQGKKAEVTFRNLDVAEWSAEHPILYDMYYEIKGSCVKQRVGFCSVEIKKDVFLVNGKRVKLHGVNHHDTDPRNGYSMTAEDIERDMKLCKEYNIDTVRTSHYPPDPYLLELCDELGIYVVDEADLETHGTYVHKLPPSYNRISDDPKWEAHYVDRAARLYQRDKMHPSIIMWSLGNEAGGIHNTDAEYEYIKRFSNLPVQYESAVHTKKKAYDVASEMYPPAERLGEIGRRKYKVKQFCDRPYFMCEYAHAMGVGPGGMEDYWKEIYEYDNLCGGCVWEMADHAVLHEDGSYTYGGDHGEWEHDKNFCVDGLFYPDRSPSTGARILKFVYRPIRVSWLGGDAFEIFNTRSFTPGEAYELRLEWNDGTEETVTPWCEPLERIKIRIRTAEHREAAREAGRDCLLTVTTIDRVTGSVAARGQIVLDERIAALPADAGRCPLPEHCLDDAAGRLCFRLGDATQAPGTQAPGTQAPGTQAPGTQAAGALESVSRTPETEAAGALESGGRTPETQVTGAPTFVVLTPTDPYTILFRAPTDNDYVFWGVKDIMRDFTDQKSEVISVENDKDSMKVVTRISCGKNVFECTDTYQACKAGLLISSRLHCVKGKGDVPRFGKAFRFESDFDTVEYYGRSGESYADMKDQFPIEQVRCTVADMTEPNIKPQESGNRFDTRWASISNGHQTVKFTAIGKAFELGIKPYSDKELLSMKHRGDEIRTGTYVTISAFQRGIGTGICGPQTADAFIYPANQDYEFRFLVSTD